VAKADLVVNAAGPWVDRLLARAPFSSPPLIGGTKGSHIVVAPFAGAPANAIYVEAQSDARPLFIIPWNNNYLIGTTDVCFEDDPDEVRSEPWEVDYLLAETNLAFPDARLTRECIRFTYSGVRPLPRARAKHEQNITRRHFIREHLQANNLLSIVGGKLTTYRKLAEECVDLIFRKLGKRSPPCMTANEVLPGAVNFTAFAKSFSDERLLRIYGSRAFELVQFAEESGSLAAAAIRFSFAQELAQTLADCFLRRTMIGLEGDLGLGQLETAAEVGRRWLGWSESRVQHEIENYRATVKRFLITTTSSVTANRERIVSEACEPRDRRV
jgi:glycerol-3-phosphate dehydrogenase